MRVQRLYWFAAVSYNQHNFDDFLRKQLFLFYLVPLLKRPEKQTTADKHLKQAESKDNVKSRAQQQS